MQLRPYQRQAVDATWAFLRAKHGNPCIVIPTGGGKTIVLAELIREALTQWPGTRICVLAHVRELVQQNHDKLRAYWRDAPAGIYSASLGRRDRFEPVIFASIQSVAKRAMSLGRFDLALVDEAHRIPLRSEGQYREFIAGCQRANPQLRIAGMTATPYRLGGGPVCGPDYILNEIAFEAGVGDLIRDGYLSRLVSKAGVSRADLSHVSVRNGEYVGRELERASDKDEIVQAACDEIVSLCADRRAWIVFCAGVAHAEHVCDALKARGIAAATVDGTTSSGERVERIEAFQRGELRALVNVNVLSEGFDATHVDAVILMRPTKSAGLYYQQVGRALRLHSGKTDALILDFAGNIVEHGPIDAIRAPRAPGQKTTSAQPMRECPSCPAVLPVQVRQCPDCGYEFPLVERPKHGAEASNAPILSDEIAEPVEYVVTGVSYARHEKPGKPVSMCVTYACGNLRRFREWVCLEHGGLPRARAVAWWMRRDGTGITPRNVEGALSATDRLLTPAAILVREHAKYPEVVGHVFADTAKAAA